MSDSKHDIRSDEKEADSTPQNPLQKLDEERPFFDSSTSYEARGNKNYFTVWTFVALIICCSIITWYIMHNANKQLATTHTIIIEHQKKSIASTDSIINYYLNLKTDSLECIGSEQIEQLNNRLLAVVQSVSENKNNERIENLLETELSKIQHEYEVLNLWCALLTVVFLIFSFFSIFKANEMANQSEDALKNMRQIEREVQRKYDSLINKIRKGQEKIGELTQTITTLEDTKIPAVKTQIEKILKDNEEKINAHVKNSISEITQHSDDKKSEFRLTVENEIKSLKPQIERGVNEYLSSKDDSSIAKIESLSKSVAKLEADISELIKGDIFKEAIESDHSDEQILDTEDELGLSDSDDEEGDDN